MLGTQHRRAFGLAAVLAVASARPAGAVVRPGVVEPPIVTSGRAARTQREVAWVRHGALDRAGLAGWTALYDRDTEVPLRLWGPGLRAPGTVANAVAAEVWARQFLAAHVAVLAPGAAASDFVMIGNQRGPGGVRSVGFAQRAGGLDVVGGTVSFAFEHDRMVLVGSTALPGIVLPDARHPRLDPSRVVSAAATWLGASGRRARARGQVAADLVIVPVVHRRGAGRAVDIDYTVAEQIAMEATDGAPGRWRVFVDAATGAAFARETALSFASGTVLFDVPDRAPSVGARHPRPAASDIHQIAGYDAPSDATGAVSWAGGGDTMVTPGLCGPYVAVTNRAGALVTDPLALAAGGSAVWSHAGDAAADAQLDAFIYANQVKEFARAHFDPDLSYLDQQISVVVNEDQGLCNAYSTGDDIHFYPQLPRLCEATGRMADVVYHELGHSLHHHVIIPGVGLFDSAMSEGAADTLAAALTGDPGIGRGFYFDATPIRDLAPAIKKQWPRDLDGEVHDDGEIYGETMWDLRTALEAHLGRDAGFARFLAIYYGTLQRAVDIPSSYAEALVADDDDGDLADGTPHDCDIMQAFAAHGLFDPSVLGGVAPPVRDGFAITLAAGATAGAASCAVPGVAAASLSWRVRGGASGELPLVRDADGGSFRATIPPQPDGFMVEYRVTATLTSGATQQFPSTLSDPYYQFITGPAATAPACGNGVVDPGEACDDGNTLAGDGCSPTCLREPALGGEGGNSSAASDAGCATRDGTRGGALWLLLALFVARLRRRRR